MTDDKVEIPQAEQDAALRELLLLAEKVLDTGPGFAETTRVEGMRLVLTALVTVEDANSKMRKDFEQRYPGAFWWADSAHLVAVAIDAEINECDVEDYAPYSVRAEGMLAFAAACVAAEQAASLEMALDGELTISSAIRALNNMAGGEEGT